MLETQYFPSIYTFAVLNRSELVQLEAHENFQKQSYRNRCSILGANKPLDLIIPVLKTQAKIPITKTRFDADGDWLKDHDRGITSAYGKTPFFEHYESRIRKILQPDTDNLWDHNKTILSCCLELIRLETIIDETTTYSKKLNSMQYMDLRNVIHPKKGLPKVTGLKDRSYLQAFGNVFVPGLSILDLLFNEGPNTIAILDAMI